MNMEPLDAAWKALFGWMVDPIIFIIIVLVIAVVGRWAIRKWVR